MKNASKGTTPLGLPLDPGCGRTRGCFHDCQRGRCTYIVTWVEAGDVITFDMKKIEPASSERWMAIAFSEDRLMGDDAVIECVIDAGFVRVYSSYNDDKINIRMEDKTAGLSNAAGSYVNGVLECSFDRVKRDDFYPHLKDLNNDYYLMFADGDAISGSIFPHRYDVLPPVTDVMVDLQSMESVGGEGPRFPLVLAHGCMMIMCWVLLPGIGLVTARYGKPLLPKTHFFGLKIWFQIHRGCMVTSVCMTILAALIVVVESEGYSKIPAIPGKQYQQLHPPLGIIVIVLAITNPIMALFRPGPESVGRQLFNWAHWGVGVVSVVLAIITIFIGLDLTKAGSSSAPIAVMAVYVVYLAAYLVAMELLPTVLKTLAAKQTKFELSSSLNLRRGSHKGYDVTTPPPTAPVAVITQPPPTIEQENRVKTIMLLVHYVITGLLSVVMVILLATHPH
ncbi:putative ferric-chelate reductase 1 [Haliotis cracherodii]|uniref:putative ferric-chelate reductase 1 n=1 Tax=Haliotis cracherodii TaxID=6455 RepID=UPI0039ED3994